MYLIKRRSAVFLLLFLTLSTLWAGYEVGLSALVLKQIEQRFGRAAQNRIVLWQQLIRHNKDLAVLDKVHLVNDFFNGLTFVSDQQQWDKNDYWATPVEFLSTGAGDCEDFTIAKYFTLLALGVPEPQLRITYVKSLTLNQAHMVLTYYPDKAQVPWVLDNLNPQLLLATQRTDLQPMYSFNSAMLWKAKQRERGERLETRYGLPHWFDVNQRMQRELQQKG